MVGRASANYEIFSLRKFTELSRTKADVASAEASELEQRFNAALETESSYYDVLVDQELSRVNGERARRAREGLAVARARVASGAAVQTDSLQLVLELVRAQVDSLRQHNALRTAQLELGRRVGADGPVDAVPLDTLPAPPLPLDPRRGAVRLALDQGPQYRAARANESSAEAALRAERGDYLPVLQRRRLAPALRHPDLPQRRQHQLDDLQPVVPPLEQRPTGDRGDPGPGQPGRRPYHPRRSGARGPAGCHRVLRWLPGHRGGGRAGAGRGNVASQTYRMQELRYRSGATTILDLLDSQVDLAEAEAGLVQARYLNRLALAQLEAILGRRLFTNKDAP